VCEGVCPDPVLLGFADPRSSLSLHRDLSLSPTLPAG
jgi:hypothetical protein